MNPLEQAAYFPVSGAHLYTVLHGAADPLARVLLVGPFASERNTSYLPWVRWARYLAARGVECLRYDYRGIGESTGALEDLSLEDWMEDVEVLAAELKDRSPDLPLILHGLELGAILAANAFEKGVADGLLLWAAPRNANEALRAALLRYIGMGHAFKYGSDRRPVSDFVKELENGHALEVEGYRWSGRLWRDSFRFELPPALADQTRAALAYTKPVRLVALDKNAAPLIKGSAVVYDTISKDFSSLFADNFEWIAAALAISGGSAP
jgi:hypothetical protein